MSSSVQPFAWRDRPSLIERLLPAQKISAEAQKERKAGAGQTLTALGSYWKGRKPLILVRACVLGALLPATDNPEADLAIFEKLMAMDDEAFPRRGFLPSCRELVERLHPRGEMSAEDAGRLFEIRRREKRDGKMVTVIEPFTPEALSGLTSRFLVWKDGIDRAERDRWNVRWVRTFTYLERVAGAKRPEELDEEDLYQPIWAEVNAHLGTDAHSFPELVEQMGILRFGQRPRVGDTFSGGGSIPFEAARLGCDVYASDLNPIACMLTWGALSIIGASAEDRRRIEAEQAEVAAAVDREITELGIEHDSAGNRAKAFLYCVEVRCPQTGWMIPLAPSWVISTNQNVIARLIPDHHTHRFRIEVASGVSLEEMERAARGTLRDGEVVYVLDGETYQTKFRIIRGDKRSPDGGTLNNLRPWDKSDFMPLPDDLLQERLYCIQWITRETLEKGRRQVTFFASVNDEDLARERRVEEIVRRNLQQWQDDGLVPDMPIELGNETTRLIKERGWTYWHHLFAARQLLLLAHIKANSVRTPDAWLRLANELNFQSKLCGMNPRTRGSGREMCLDRVFINQALNTLNNYGVRSAAYQADNSSNLRSFRMPAVDLSVRPSRSCDVRDSSHYWITDPPYADAVAYHEITEYFIAWLRRKPPVEFENWLWDSRRSMAIVGSGEEFRRDMVGAYRAMADHMPDNGLQIVMFTHQDAGVWADMAAIVWGAGLQVTAAWYIATETSSELKKGGYVQGTVLLVLRKRPKELAAYSNELVHEVRAEVAQQIETMTGLNQVAKGAGRSENIFEDQDLQMAGYAAALRVLTGYSRIDGQDMAAEALRPRRTGGVDTVRGVIGHAVEVANEFLVPEGISPGLWELLNGPERFYIRMLDIEAGGAKKLDNYQNFAKAFRYGDYTALMASTKANDARLKTALELKKSEFDSDFGKGTLRAVLYALYELQREVDIDAVILHLREMVPGYLTRRDDILALVSALATMRANTVPAEAEAARILYSRLRNQRLG